MSDNDHSDKKRIPDKDYDNQHFTDTLSFVQTNVSRTNSTINRS